MLYEMKDWDTFFDTRDILVVEIWDGTFKQKPNRKFPRQAFEYKVKVPYIQIILKGRKKPLKFVWQTDDDEFAKSSLKELVDPSDVEEHEAMIKNHFQYAYGELEIVYNEIKECMKEDAKVYGKVE